MVAKNHLSRRRISILKLDFKETAAAVGCGTTIVGIRWADFIFAPTIVGIRRIKVNSHDCKIQCKLHIFWYSLVASLQETRNYTHLCIYILWPSCDLMAMLCLWQIDVDFKMQRYGFNPMEAQGGIFCGQVETGYLIHLKSNDLRLFAKVIV
jgi:hypothetical protein